MKYLAAFAVLALVGCNQARPLTNAEYVAANKCALTYEHGPINGNTVYDRGEIRKGVLIPGWKSYICPNGVKVIVDQETK